MLVYRFQNQEGYGPYIKPPEWGGEYYFDDAKCHPVPLQDPGFQHFKTSWGVNLPWDGDRRFCFASLAQARAWFHKPCWLEAMERAGFELVEFEVPRGYVIEGHFQAIFHVGHATEVRRMKPLELIQEELTSD